MVLLFIFVCESVDNLGIFDDMKQNTTKTLETLRLKLFHHKGIYPNINFLLKIKTMLTLFQPSSTQSNTKTRVFKLNYNIILNLLLIKPNILFLQINQSQTQKLAKLLSRSHEGWIEVYPCQNGELVQDRVAATSFKHHSKLDIFSHTLRYTFLCFDFSFKNS